MLWKNKFDTITCIQRYCIKCVLLCILENESTLFFERSFGWKSILVVTHWRSKNDASDTIDTRMSGLIIISYSYLDLFSKKYILFVESSTTISKTSFSSSSIKLLFKYHMVPFFLSTIRQDWISSTGVPSLSHS